MSVYDSHVPDETRKKGALCVGVIDGVALVTVAEADKVLVPVMVIEADVDALSVDDSLALSLAVWDAVIEALSLALLLAVSLALDDDVMLALLLAVLLGVIVLLGDTPMARLQMHLRVEEHSDTVSSVLK